MKALKVGLSCTGEKWKKKIVAGNTIKWILIKAGFDNKVSKVTARLLSGICK